jgi:hypothetical protein
MVMVVIAMSVRTNSYSAFDAADDSARYSAHKCANRSANRTENAMADVASLVCTLSRALGDLSMRRERQRKQGKNTGR